MPNKFHLPGKEAACLSSVPEYVNWDSRIVRMAKPGKFAGVTWVGITPISVVFRQEHRSITTIPLRDNPHLSAVTGVVGRE